MTGKKRNSAQGKPPPAAGGVAARPESLNDAQQQQAEFFRALTENSRDGIVVINRDGTVRYESTFGERTLGRKPGDRIGKSMFERVHPDDAPAVSDAFAQLVENLGATVSVEVRLQHDDGSWRLLEATGRSLLDNPAVQGIVVNFHDVTERRRAEEMARESEVKCAALIEQANDGLAIVQDEVITFVNKAFASLTGYSAEELVGMHALNIVASEHGPMVAERYKSRVAGEQAAPSYEFKVQCKDGTTKDVELSATAIEYEGRPASMATLRDITERKRAEADLLREKSFLEGLVGSLPGLFYLYLISGKGGFVRWNENLETVSGYSSDEIREVDYLEFIASDDKEKMLEGAQRTLDAGYASVEAELLTKDGRKIPHLFMGSPVTIENDEYIIGFALDISERKRAEEALMQSEEYFRALIENSMDSITVLNADGSLRWESPSAARMLGYEEGEGTGKTSFELVHPDDTSQVSDALPRLLQNPGGAEYLELRIKHRDGSWRTLEVVARNLLHDEVVAGIVVNQRDITERKQAEEELSRSEEKLRLMFDSVSDSVSVTDLEGTITEVNDRCLEMHGAICRDDLLGKSAFDLIAPRDRERAVRNASRTQEEGSVASIEYVLARLDGSEYPGELSANLLKDASGSPVGFIAVVRDITARKSAEQEKLRTEEQRQLTARLATVGQLAAGVAHELNNPLAAVQGFAQLLADRKDLEDSVRDDVEQIFNEAKRATRITANLLSFARKHRPEKRLTCINEVIEKSLELHAYRMRVNNVDVQTELAAGLPATMADFHQMQQVFVNIIANADQAMTEAHGKGKLSVRSQWSGDTIKITLIDDGPGIPQEDLEKIFEPFYTTKEEGKGTGLGLDICRGIVEAHGGRMRATGNVGEGTTFVIEIPVVTEGQAIEEDYRVQSPGAQS